MAMNAKLATRARGASRQHGATVLGFLAGLIIGLGIAVVVALFVTRAPVPFVNKANRAPDPALTRDGRPPPDPNAPLNSRARDALPGDPSSPTTAATPPAQASRAPSSGGDTAAQAPNVGAQTPPSQDASGSGSYVLQAGSFRASDDAEGMKARLALLGYEARVVAADVNGQTMYRVRIGPFAQQEDANRARGRLLAGGVESAVMRQR